MWIRLSICARHLVLTQGIMPHDGQRALQNIERQGNPWGISRNDRVKWVKEVDPDDELGVRTVKENPEFEYLFFLGSMGASIIAAARSRILL